ncbi:hypothetical protein K439DRAFT_1297436, partial [Ramaria rubella]
QNKALRRICAAFKTTPVRALQIEAACLPIKHKLDLLSTQAALRFNRLSRHSQVIQRLTQAWRGATPSNPTPPLPPNRPIRTSGGVRQVGAALVLYHQSTVVCEHTIGMGLKAEVYDAEMEGLAQAAESAVTYATNHRVPIKHLHFFADNTSAIQNIFEAKP